MGRAEETGMSLNSELVVVPAPGAVKIDGDTADWDLSAGVWSYNTPVIAGKFSVWTHMMWDAKGVYFLARFADSTPMQNPTRGKDFANSWKNDCYQARVVFDDRTPEEHEMHVNLFYSASEAKAYMIVKHGGFLNKPPYDETGPDRPDQLEKYGPTMEKAGGQIAFKKWENGKGYNCEAFWPWSYCRTTGQALKSGESFTFGIEALWGGGHRLADGIKDDKVNRIFMFRARTGWGKAVISAKGKLAITAEQENLHATKLKGFLDYDTYGSIALAYALPTGGGERDVTIAIDNASGKRVRNLFGQYPRKAGENKDFWDGLDDDGRPVPAGKYNVTVVDHQPVEVKFFNSLYNAATPPWVTESGRKLWGANHGNPSGAAARGEVTLLTFVGVEGMTGIQRVDNDGIIQWAVTDEVTDVAIGEKLCWVLSANWGGLATPGVQRYDVQTGAQMPFADAARSPVVALPVDLKGTSPRSTIALYQGKLYALVLPYKLFKLDPETGKIEAQYDVGDLAAVTGMGEKLYYLTKSGEVGLWKEEGREKLCTVGGLKDPARLAIRQDGKALAISDQGSNQVFVCNLTGRITSTIGRPYPGTDRPAGKFIETDVINPLGLAFDAQGRLWLAEANGATRRVTTWTLNTDKPVLAKSFWGAADYGASHGFPVTYDSTRFIVHGIEFALDPKPEPLTKPTAEKPLMYHPALYAGEGERYLARGLVYRYKDHDYACALLASGRGGALVIAKRNKDGVFTDCVRLIMSGRKHVNGQWVNIPGRAWIDRNDNGIAEDNEWTENVASAMTYWSNGYVRPDLTIITTDQLIYRPTGFTEGGVPLYDFAKPEKAKNTIVPVQGDATGGAVVMDMAGNITDGIAFHTVDGRRGQYPNRYGRHTAPAAQRGVLIAPFRTNGVVENVPGVGAITALGGDRGEWFLLSTDGLYLSSILQDIKGDMTLDETLTGSESFGGFIWKDPENRILVQLGGPSFRIMEVKGLETTRKQTFTLNVSAEQIAAGAKIAAARMKTAGAEPKELTIARAKTLPAEPVAADLAKNQPLLAGVPEALVKEQGDASRWFRVALAQDGKDLAVLWQVADASPWKNGAGKFTHAFVGGDCVDLKLNVPGRGPVRVLVAPIERKDTVVYFQAKAAIKENPVTYMVGNNAANGTTLDVVKRFEAATAKSKTGMGGYSVLLRVPLAELGIDPAKVAELAGTVGVIYSDPTGTNRVARMYWFDKGTGLVSDVPSEARLDAAPWGKVIVGK